MQNLLANSAPALLFTIIGLGYFIGNIKIKGFSLGIAAVLFVGLFFGAVNPDRFVIPEVIYVLGLILFVYTVGLQSGPVFFNLFRRQWLKLSILSLSSIFAAALIALLAAKFLGIDYPTAAGIFCGGLGNTPALAAAIETLRNSLSAASLDSNKLRLLLDAPTVGYSMAYPYGVIGVILAIQLVSKFSHVDFKREEQKALKDAGFSGEEPSIREVRITNPQIIGKTFGEAMLTELTGMVFTRIKRGDEATLVTPDVILHEGDVLRGVGSAAAISKAVLLVGPAVQEAIDDLSPDITHFDLVVINRKVAGMGITELQEAVGRPVIVSRIRRGSVHIVPSSNATLELGDQIRVVIHSMDLPLVTQVIGNPLKDISEADYLSFGFGLVLGVAIGMIPIPLFGSTFKLGFAGGPLIAGLILGRIGRTGPIVWNMPSNAALTLRQLGLLFFLAGIGTRAGGSFMHAFVDQGIRLILIGILVTTSTSLLVIFGARKIFKYDMISTFGILTGVHTAPSSLAFANAYTGSENSNITYAAVYPVALISKIILAQLLVAL